MAHAGDLKWSGRRTPSKRLALFVLAVVAVLVLLAYYEITYQDREVNLAFLAILIMFAIIYAALVLTAYAEVTLELQDETLVLKGEEHAVGKRIRERTSRVDRHRMAKLVERNAGAGVLIVRIEDEQGRRLLTFPKFLEEREHDAMVAAILEWGNRP